MQAALDSARGRHLGWLALAALSAALGLGSAIAFLWWTAWSAVAIPEWSSVFAGFAAAALQLVGVGFWYWIGVGSWRRADRRC